ncbi:hypothetical protein [Aquella oligotrophica]|nr:hypothetical protein [Aquella oligotrophica]
MSTIQKILALQALNACKKESCMGGGGGSCSKGKCSGSCSSKSNCNHIG